MLSRVRRMLPAPSRMSTAPEAPRWPRHAVELFQRLAFINRGDGAFHRVGAGLALDAQQFAQPLRRGPFVVVQHGEELHLVIVQRVRHERIAHLRDAALRAR